MKIKNKNIIAFIFFTLFWASFVFISGTLTSGYHFTDDHEVISFNKNIQNNGLLDASKSIIKEDLKERFRPFYYLHRIIIIKLFGTNILIPSICNVFLAIFTSFFLFLFVFRQGYKFFHSLLFPLLTLVGEQSAVFWRLGPAETIGFFLFSASLFFLANSIFKRKSYQIIISVILLLFATLSKESFVIVIPAYIFILFWLNYQHDTNATIFNVIRKNIIIISCVVIVLLIEICFIIFAIGTHKNGYAGIDNSFKVLKFMEHTYVFLRYNIYVYLMAFGLFLLMQNNNFRQLKYDENLKKKIKPLAYAFSVLILVIMPQFILYDKSGIYERYLLPLNFGLSLFVIFLLKQVYLKTTITLFSKRVFVVFITLTLLTFLKNYALPNAKEFTKEGISTNNFLSKIETSTKSNDSILVVLNSYENFEWGYSIKDYLTIKAGRNNFYFYILNKPFANDFATNLKNKFSREFDSVIVKDLNSNFSCIAILPFSTDKEIKNKLDSNELYQRVNFDIFTLYSKKKNNDVLK